MKNYCIIVNTDKPGAMDTAVYVRDFICDRAAGAQVQFITDMETGPLPDTECIITVGGDGTVIEAARKTVGRRIPILGINRGHTGYLTELGKELPDEGLMRLLSGHYKAEDRMMLDASVIRGGKTVFTDFALNEVAINRAEYPGSISFGAYVNDTYLTDYKADGILAATPTGSTAYSFSAGGPIAEPGSRIIILTPICPHMINNRSVILSPDDEVKLIVGPEPQRVYCDGTAAFDLAAGDAVIIKCSENVTRLIMLREMSFVERLAEKINYT